MKKLSILFAVLFLFISACDKEKEDIVDTSSNDIEDINTLDRFETVIGQGVSMMFFHASWCTVCAEQRPAFDATSMNSSFTNVSFGEIEFEYNNAINQPYQITGFPTIVIYKDGVEVERFTGKGHSETTLADALNAVL